MTMVAKIKIAVIVLLVSLSLAVIIQNTSSIEAKILFLTISIPLTVLIGGSLIVGYLLGLLTPVLWRRRQEGSPEGPAAAETGAGAESRAAPDDPRPGSPSSLAASGANRFSDFRPSGPVAEATGALTGTFESGRSESSQTGPSDASTATK